METWPALYTHDGNLRLAWVLLSPSDIVLAT